MSALVVECTQAVVRDQAVRQACGVSLDEAAGRAFVSVKTIRRWEADERLITNGRLRRKCERYYKRLRAWLSAGVALEVKDATPPSAA